VKWIPTLVVAITIAANGCNACGPEQHAITTSSNSLMMGGGIPARQIQFVTYRLTQPPATSSTRSKDRPAAKASRSR